MSADDSELPHRHQDHGRPNITQEQYNQIIRDYQGFEMEIGENTRITKDIHRILVGEPQYKRKGLVEIVDFHHLIVTWGVGGLFVINVGWIIFSAYRGWK